MREPGLMSRLRARFGRWRRKLGFWTRAELRVLALPAVSPHRDLVFVLTHERFHCLGRVGPGMLLGLKPVVGDCVKFTGTLDQVLRDAALVLRLDHVDEIALLRDSALKRAST